MLQQKLKTTRENNINSALQALKNPSQDDSKLQSISHTALKFGISRASLRRAIANNEVPYRQGPPKVLTDHEEE